MLRESAIERYQRKKDIYILQEKSYFCSEYAIQIKNQMFREKRSPQKTLFPSKQLRKNYCFQLQIINLIGFSAFSEAMNGAT